LSHGASNISASSRARETSRSSLSESSIGPTAGTARLLSGKAAAHHVSVTSDIAGRSTSSSTQEDAILSPPVGHPLLLHPEPQSGLYSVQVFRGRTFRSKAVWTSAFQGCLDICMLVLNLGLPVHQESNHSSAPSLHLAGKNCRRPECHATASWH
jgi:hypothetical protein